MIDRVAMQLIGRRLGHPLRVGVDGICAAGKTTFAGQLVDRIADLGRPAVHLDSDGFHHTRSRRYRQGRTSAEGYYLDGYDFVSLAEKVLRPLGPRGTREYAVRVHDLTTDRVLGEFAMARPDEVVVFAATFIQRDALRDLWDEVIYLEADERTALERGVHRDAAALGGKEAALAAYRMRYMAACRIYVKEQDPRGRASIVIDNTDPTAPIIQRLGGHPSCSKG